MSALVRLTRALHAEAQAWGSVESQLPPRLTPIAGSFSQETPGRDTDLTTFRVVIDEPWRREGMVEFIVTISETTRAR